MRTKRIATTVLGMVVAILLVGCGSKLPFDATNGGLIVNVTRIGKDNSCIYTLDVRSDKSNRYKTSNIEVIDRCGKGNINDVLYFMNITTGGS